MPVKFLSVEFMDMYDFLDEITEIRTSCGFRENMIQEANRPFDGVDFKWPICSILESLIQECIFLLPE